MKYTDIINNWTDQQKKIIEASENFIVEGIAGSGKTLLAIEKAKRIIENKLGSVQVVVYTKALRRFIENNIDFPDLPNGIVFHYHEWKKQHKQEQKIDYLIVDELQDFSPNEINDFVINAKTCYFFRDGRQQIYNLEKKQKSSSQIIYDKTVVSISINKIKFKLFHLGINLRANRENVTFINKLFSLDDISGRTNFGMKPEVFSFVDANKEIEWICNYLKSKNEDIGVLLLKNEGVQTSSTIGISIDKKSKVDIDCPISYGVKEIVSYLTNKDIDIGYKYGFEDELFFSSEINTKNVMTIHSSKGLQFDTVILPFMNDNYWVDKNILYTAMTRASKKLIITMNSVMWQGDFLNFLNNNKNNDLYKLHLNDLYFPFFDYFEFIMNKKTDNVPKLEYKSSKMTLDNIEKNENDS